VGETRPTEITITTARAARRARDQHLEERFQRALDSIEALIGHFTSSTDDRDMEVHYTAPTDLADRLATTYRDAGWDVVASRGTMHVDLVLRLPPPVEGVHPERHQPDGSPVLDFWRFVYERQRIHARRAAGLPRHEWTTDPVLRSRFFTNIFRDLDPGTAIATEIVSRERPAWERLWNLMVYRRFNREETWRNALGYWDLADVFDKEKGAVYPFDLLLLRNMLRERYVELARYATETGQPIFTDAHQVYPMPSIPGPDLPSRFFRVMLDVCYPAREPISLYGLADKLAAAGTRREAFRAFVDAKIPGISNFLSWQMTMDCTYGPDPIVKADDDWAPITTGARFGAIMWARWPEVGTVNHPVEGWPELESIPPRELEQFVQGMRDEQDERFEERGLDWGDVSGGRRLDMSALEHALCEYQKYVNGSVGMPTRDRWAQAPPPGTTPKPFDGDSDKVVAALAAIDFEGLDGNGELAGTGEASPAGGAAPPGETESDRAHDPPTRPAPGSAYTRFRAAVLAIHERGDDPTPRAIFAELGMNSVSLNTRQAGWRREILAELGYVRDGQRYVRGDA